MATKLVKPVTRELLGLKSRKKGKPILVTLEGGDEISFRVKGERKSYSVGLGHCLVLAQIMTADNEYKNRVEKYNTAKKAGKRVKRPKRPFLPYSKFYFNALTK